MTNKILINRAAAGIAGVLGLAGLVLAGGALTTQAQTATSTAPVISAVSVTPTDMSATVTWTTDQTADSQVAYGTSLPYGTYSALDSNNVTSHSVTLSGLTPGTTYHYEVLAENTATTSPVLATSSDATFMTTNTGSTGTTTASSTLPAISSIFVSPTDTSATVTWMTDQPSTSQIAWGTSATYNASTTLDSNNVTSHLVTLSGLSPGTTYHYEVLSGDTAGTANSVDQSFVTTNTSSTTDTSTLQNEITALQSRVSTLEQEVASFLGSTGSTTVPQSGPPTVDQNATSLSTGGSIDFGGRNFHPEETVTIMMNGNTVATAHADGGGNFSTGSLTGPGTAGTYTYLFEGSSGDAANATITVH